MICSACCDAVRRVEPPYAPTISTLSSRPRRRDVVALAAIQRRCNSRTDGVGGATCRVGVEMSVTLGSCGLHVTEELTDDRQPEAAARADAGKGMPQIMDAKTGKRSGLGHRRPGFLEIGSGSFRARARNDIWPHPV